MVQRSGVFCLGLLLFVLGFSDTAHAFTITRVSSPIFYRDADAALVGAHEGYLLTNNDGVAYADPWVASQGFAVGAKIHLATNEDGRVNVGPLAAGASATVFFYLLSDAATASPESHTIRVYKPDNTTVASQSFSLTASETIQASPNTVSSVTTPGPSVRAR